MNAVLDKKLVLLGTGGTIAGLADDAHDNLGYQAAQVGIEVLLQALPQAHRPNATLISEQVTQVDSKDMRHDVWQLLAQRCAFWLSDPQVAGIVVTHGTDTMEETAFLLHEVLAGAAGANKPVVLTGAMRPASSMAPDGPQNMLDALLVASDPHARGVMVVFAGDIHGAREVQKVHAYRLNAFGSGEAGLLGRVEAGAVTWVRLPPARTVAALGEPCQLLAVLPRVEIVTSHAGATGSVVDALLAVGAPDALQGLIVAGTGNASVHATLEAALVRAQRQGVVVWRSSRCGSGHTVGHADSPWPDSAGLPPAKARIALMLHLRQGAGAAVSGLHPAP